MCKLLTTLENFNDLAMNIHQCVQEHEIGDQIRQRFIATLIPHFG